MTNEDFQNELTAQEADEILEEIAFHEAQIRIEEKERDDFIEHYQKKIAAAEHLFDIKTREDREAIANLTEKLRRYARENVTEKRRSVKLPSGTMSFRKVAPKFFFDTREVSGTCEPLIKFVKENAPDYLKIKSVETADWATFKKQLVINGEEIYYKETGERIEGMRVKEFPDEFTVKTGID